MLIILLQGMIEQNKLPPGTFVWPYIPFPALVGAAFASILGMMVLTVSHYMDTGTGGLLTLSILIVMAFVLVTFASLIYEVPQTPTTEILIGALSTSVGAIVAYWMSHRSGPPNA